MLTQSTIKTMTRAEIEAKLLALEAAKNSKIKLKVSEKGGVSLYGIGRWPATFYKSQWETILGQAEAIVEFMKENAELLSEKE